MDSPRLNRGQGDHPPQLKLKLFAQPFISDCPPPGVIPQKRLPVHLPNTLSLICIKAGTGNMV